MDHLRLRRSTCFILSVLIAVGVGCSESSPKRSPVDKSSAPAKRAAKKESTSTKRETSADDASPADLRPQRVVRDDVPASEGDILAPDVLDDRTPEIPPVVMSEQHAVTCLVRVGDTMPDARLTDLSGKEQDLSKLLGDKLTVVFFFSTKDRHSLDQVGDMAVQIASPLAAQGVKVVGICERDKADIVRRECEKQGVSYPVLLDPTGKFYRQLATAHLARTYLLDATGKVLWFDIEYVRATRRDLREALRALLVQ